MAVGEEFADASESYLRSVACHLCGGQLFAVAGVVGIEVRENYFFKISAYVWLVSKYIGLSRWHGRREEGRSMPSGIDFLINCSKFASIHSQASGRLFFVVTIRHLFLATDLIHKNHGFLSR